MKRSSMMRVQKLILLTVSYAIDVKIIVRQMLYHIRNKLNNARYGIITWKCILPSQIARLLSEILLLLRGTTQARLGWYTIGTNTPQHVLRLIELNVLSIVIMRGLLR